MDGKTLQRTRGRGVIERYRDFLPVSSSTPIISLGEGSTPLIPCPRLSERVGRGCEVHVKYEGLNPTCSFKDRGMTVAVSKAIEQGIAAVICASTGNTSASAAAYAARAGIRCAVVLPAGKIASGKLLQALVYGAKVVAIEGNFDDALRIVRELGQRKDFAIVNSINPDRIEGQTTAAFEVVDDLGDAPHFHLLPVGNAGNITAYWKGYRVYRDAGRSTRLPQMIGFQAAGAAPIVHDKIIERPGDGCHGDPHRKSSELVRCENRDRRIARRDLHGDGRRNSRSAELAREQGRDFCRTRQRGFHRWTFQMRWRTAGCEQILFVISRKKRRLSAP